MPAFTPTKMDFEQFVLFSCSAKVMIMVLVDEFDAGKERNRIKTRTMFNKNNAFFKEQKCLSRN